MGNPRILYLSDSDISKPGGAQQSMKVLMQGLKPQFDIFIVTPNGEEILNNQIILKKYEHFKLRGKTVINNFRMIKDIYKIIKKIQPNIIHVQMTSTLIIVNLLLQMGWIDSKIKVIYTDRGVYGRYGRITTLSIDSFIKKADKIITTTVNNKKNYVTYYKHYQQYKDKFMVIYNTAGENFDNYDINLKPVFRKKQKFDEKDFVIGLCGRYSDQKNWPLALEIIKLCNSQLSNLSFVIVLGTEGSVSSNYEADKYIEEVRQVLGDNKLNAFVNLSNDEVSEIYYAMDCFLLTSKWESFGRTAVEAMSRKNIVIGTDVDGLSEVIGNREYLFASAQEAFDIIQVVMDSNIELRKQDFYNRYHENFGSRKNILMYKKLYNEILIEQN